MSNTLSLLGESFTKLYELNNKLSGCISDKKVKNISKI